MAVLAHQGVEMAERPWQVEGLPPQVGQAAAIDGGLVQAVVAQRDQRQVEQPGIAPDVVDQVEQFMPGFRPGQDDGIGGLALQLVEQGETIVDRDDLAGRGLAAIPFGDRAAATDFAPHGVEPAERIEAGLQGRIRAARIEDGGGTGRDDVAGDQDRQRLQPGHHLGVAIGHQRQVERGQRRQGARRGGLAAVTEPFQPPAPATRRAELAVDDDHARDYRHPVPVPIDPAVTLRRFPPP
jgi:hypothetical protein